MASIFPDTSNGGVIVRNPDGTPIPVSNVPNAYVPPVAFTTSCDLTYLYNDCFSRVAPAQVNALQSELLCLAATMDPEGSWDCSSLCNLSTAFDNFIANFQSQEIGDQLCGVADGDGTEATARLIYCDGAGLAKALPITGSDSLFELFSETLCGVELQNPNDPTSIFLFCDGSGNIRGASIFDIQYYRGPWVQAYAYSTSQMVQRNDRLYSPNDAIPAGTPFIIGTTGATWREVSSSGIDPHDPSAAYAQDDIVSRTGMLYAANDDIPAGTVFVIGTSGQTWRLFDLSETHILEFSPEKTYTRYSTVSRQGLLYRATNAEIPAGPWMPSQWEMLGGERNVYRGVHSQAQAYQVGDTVEQDALLYRANGNIPANTPFAIGTVGATWRLIGQAKRKIELALSVSQGWGQDEILAAYIAPEAFTLPALLADSRGVAQGSPFLSTSLSIRRQGATIGTAQIGGAAVTFTFATDVSVSPGEVLTFVPTSTATFDFVSITLVGSR